MQLTKADISRNIEKAHRMKARAETLVKKGDEMLETLVHTVETGSAALAFGVLEGRYDGLELMGMPGSLLAAGAGHLLGFMGFGGKMSSHLHGFANGALAAYTHTLGLGIGKTWRKEAGKSPAGVLDDEKLARLAMAGAGG